MHLRVATLLRTAALTAMATIALAACGTSEPTFVEAPAECLFPRGTVLGYSGITTLERAGLEPGLMTEETPGELYVTADRITIPENDQNDLHRRFCMVYPPGTGLSQVSGLVPDSWAPPVAP